METKTKYYTSEQISNEFEKLTKDEKISVLYNAISYMQNYSGRSRFLCIAMAMGYDNYEGDNKSYYKR